MAPTTVAAGECLPDGSVEMRRYILEGARPGDTFRILTGDFRKIVDLRRHGKTIFCFHRSVFDEINGTTGRNRGKLLELRVSNLENIR